MGVFTTSHVCLALNVLLCVIDTMSDRFVMLYKKADALMDSCMLAETQDDFMAAFNYCETALSELCCFASKIKNKYI